MKQKDQNEIPHQISTNQDDLISAIKYYHEHMFLDKAYDLTITFQEKQKIDQDNFIEDKALFYEIHTFHKETQFLKQQLQDNQDWVHDCNTQYFKMSYKFIPNTNNVALKFESVMKVPILNACALIYQTELFNKWVPFCKISKALKRPSLGHKICYILMNLPVLSNREAYIRGYGVDYLEQSKSFLICCQSIHNDKEYQQKYNINTSTKDNVQVDINFFAVEVIIINSTEFIMKSVANLDPKMKFIPQSVMNFLIKKIGKYMYEKFIKMAQNISGTEWEKQMKEDPIFYDHIKKRCEQYCSKY